MREGGEMRLIRADAFVFYVDGVSSLGKEDSVKNKVRMFEERRVRSVWDEAEEKWWFCVMDVVGVLTDATDQLTARKYWNKVAQRLRGEGNETVTNCHQLKIRAEDGKMRLADVMDTEQILRLVQSIPSKKVEPFKMWLARVGSEFIDETVDPERAMNRAVTNYRRLGYSENWINQRLKTIEARKALTDEWDKSGVKEGSGYARLTDLMYKTWAEMSAREYRRFKGLRKENLRDNMTNAELVLNMLAEVAATDLSIEISPTTPLESERVAKSGAEVAKNARVDFEQRLGRKVISPQNVRGLREASEEREEVR